MKNYKQTTFETCLAVNLLQLIDADLSHELEMEVITHALNFSRDQFALGHLDFIAKRYGKVIDFYVNDEYAERNVNECEYNEMITVFSKKVDLGFIDERVQESPAIVYIDSCKLWWTTHSPHFIIVLRKNGKNYDIYDPWDGKEKTITSHILSSAVHDLRDYLHYCPQLIQL